MPGIEVKVKRQAGGGLSVEAGFCDWELAKRIPDAILNDIIAAMVAGFIAEYGKAIMDAITPEKVAEGIADKIKDQVTRALRLDRAERVRSNS